MNQRIGVDHFDLTRGAQEARRVCAECLTDCEQQRRSKAFATGKNAPANRAMQPRRFHSLLRNQPIKLSINQRAAREKELTCRSCERIIFYRGHGEF